MGNEYRVFGPPGTGKTTYLMNKIALGKKDYGIEGIFVSSFTKAAATEISNRATSGMTVPKGIIGTLHSHCYRALDFPELAENYVDEFCKQHPQFAIKTDTDIDNPFDVSGTAPMEQTYLEMNRLRGLMVPPEMWPLEVRVLRDKWETWKRGENYFDFTDLLEIAYRDIPKAPNDPKVGFIDEAQDMTPLQFAIVRKWGQFMNHLFIVGDEDQTLYEFLGASPESMLEPKIDDDLIVVLSQSHRVPRAVQRWAENVIKRVEKRQPKQYRPRDVEGEVRHSVATAADPSAIFSDVSDDVKAGKTVMILASCAYMLSDVIQGLRAMGMAYHNPYRPQQGAWNPLRGATAALASFLRFDKAVWGDAALPTWTEADLNRWVKYVKSTAGLKRGAKEKLKRGEGLGIVDVFDADASFFMAFASNRERLDWYLENLTAEGKRRMEFPMKLYRRDPKQIAEKPKVIVGTIHSVKGGEADSVYVFPDMSRPQVQTWYSSPKGMDSLRRVYYVAGTRAREKLTLCRASHGVFGFPLTEGCI